MPKMRGSKRHLRDLAFTSAPIDCPCGDGVKMLGKIDAATCLCGREYVTEPRGTVIAVYTPYEESVPSEPTETIEITRTPRGFNVYGDPLRTPRGGSIRVYESSNALGPHVWLSVERLGDEEEATVELDERAARGLLARLQAFVNSIPNRWADR